jgi:hypothetical protein
MQDASNHQSSPARVAPIGKQTPRIEAVDTKQLQADEFINRMNDMQEADDAIGAMQMLSYALLAFALTCAAFAVAIFFPLP